MIDSITLDDVVNTLILFFPSMVTNAFPVLTRVLFKEKHPIDFNKYFIDGGRVFGDGKTWEGFLLGILSSLSVGISYTYILGSYTWVIYSLTAGLGALLGDLLNAFVKRRLGIRTGAPFPPFDQVDYLLGSYCLVKVLNIDLLLSTSLELKNLLIGMMISLILHPLTNFIAYMIKVKDVPW